MELSVSKSTGFYGLTMLCAIVAGGLWYVWPELGGWPLVMGLLPWGVRWWQSGRVSQPTRFDIPLLLFLLTALVSMGSAYDRPAGWAKFWVIVAGLLLFYALANTNHQHDNFLYHNARLLALFGAGVSVYFLATHDWVAYPAKLGFLTSVGEAIQTPLPALPGHKLHPNVVGGILAMLSPFAGGWLWLAWREGVSRPGQALSLITTTTLLFGLFMTTSRGAWLALGLALLLVGVWWLVGRFRPGQEAPTIALLGGSALAIFALSLALQPEQTYDLLNRLPGLGGEFSRVELFRTSLLLVQDYPLIGAGLDGFMMLYSSYVYLIHVGYIVHAHNLFLDLAIEQGLIGLLSLGWLVLTSGWWWLQHDWSNVSQRPDTIRAMALLSLFILLFHGLVDDALYGSRAVLLLFVPFAFISLPKREPRPQKWLAPAITLGVLGVVGLLAGKSLLSTVYANLGAVSQSRTELAVYSWPAWPVQDEVRRTQDLSASIDYFERALSLNPNNVVANRRLGLLYLSLGEYNLAQERLEMAYVSRPGDNTVRQLYGEALLVTGRVEEGTQLWQTVTNDRDQLTLRAFWYEYIGDTERLAIVRQAQK